MEAIIWLCFMTKEEKREYNRKRYQANREKILEQKKEYDTEHKAKIAEYKKQHYQDNRAKILEQKKQYNNTPIGRANYLLNANIRNDKKYYRIGDELPSDYVTAQWIVKNIFTKPCAHCGKEGWKIIGCNRLDNSKPHTKDNVEPCCALCNSRLPRQ